MLALVQQSVGFVPTVAPIAPATRVRSAPVMETVDDLKALAPKLCAIGPEKYPGQLRILHLRLSVT